MNIAKVDHIEINVADVEESKKFFIEKLGFKLFSVIPGEGVFVNSGDAMIGLFNGKPIGFVHIAFTVDDVEKAQAELIEKGLEFRRKPMVNAGTGRMITGLKDPDGNNWQLAKKVQKGNAEV
ncbi:VOC family protein [Candidatus Bathyarchaeota archaeon]|nr:VOC family protein [Candidatus Bathyarchaeota archaeon]